MTQIAPGGPYDAALAERVRKHVTGRADETYGIVAALRAARHLVLEGPPGTGKSTLLRSLAGEAGLGFAIVEGSTELTPARLIGWHDPSRLLAEGYTATSFVEGPLATAMRAGGILYVEEMNRVPEETLNVLITVMSEGELNVPRVGCIRAAPGFRLIAAMNPYDTVGTSRIPAAISDRMCRIVVGYQTAEEERTIVAARAPAVPHDLVTGIVALVRATREHAELRQGSSVRGAIDVALLAQSYAELRAGDVRHLSSLLSATLTALSGRVRVDEVCDRTPEEILTALFYAHLAGLAAPTNGAAVAVPSRADSAGRDGPPEK